jgi:hypothetical protein
MPLQTANEPIKTEVLKDAIEWGVCIAWVMLLYYSEHPSEWTLAKMRIALTGKRQSDKMTTYFENKANWWKDTATRFAQWYNELRL